MKAREGDLIETYEDSIFDVKGLVHPPNNIIAFIRYLPDEKGERRKGAATYRKIYSLSKIYRVLKEKYPKYLVHDPTFDATLCEVPVTNVKKYYRPIEKLRELRSSRASNELEAQTLQLAERLKETTSIPWNSIGISGSILVGLQSESSDIDLVVYGSENCRVVYSALRDFLKEKSEPFRSYNREDLKDLFDFLSRSPSGRNTRPGSFRNHTRLGQCQQFHFRKLTNIYPETPIEFHGMLCSFLQLSPLTENFGFQFHSTLCNSEFSRNSRLACNIF